jgi:histidine triad (HIT) family protein
MDCLFCQIAEGKIPAKIVYQDDLSVAFADINPKAPIHLLIVPREHLASINELTADNQAIASHLLLVAKKLAADNNLSANGYRLVFNVNEHAGQTVQHLHLHLLGGHRLAGMA